MVEIESIYSERASYSQIRLNEFRKRLAELPELADFPTLAIFGAGSYARLEASQYSDIDMFFLSVGDRDAVPEPRTKSLRLFGKIIDVADKMDFPKFSNDCEYLTILHSSDMLEHLGSPKDDHENYFTARMLLLLESCCLYGDSAFEQITAEIINRYFKDFPDHEHTFQPVFLLNDICRFWKTLLLNYEKKRNPSQRGGDSEQKKAKQKVRNFKLKYSRMTTCFASMAALGSYRAPVTQEQVVQLTKLTPRERLESIKTRVPEVGGVVDEVLESYAWFLEKTGLPTAELEGHFSDKEKRVEMFKRANDYGDSMFKLLQAIDATDPEIRLLRYLVI